MDTKKITELFPTGDEKKIESTIFTGMVINLPIGLVISSILYFSIFHFMTNFCLYFPNRESK